MTNRGVHHGGRDTLARFIERFAISETLSLPLDAVTKRFAVLARREGRQTHAATVLVEEMVSDRLPVVVLDTRGTWHGLGQAANSTGPGLPVHVIGGPHGDLDVRDTSGRLVADCVMALAQPVVVDLSSLPKAALQHFTSDFADQLRAQPRGMMHLVVDEAHAIFGQRATRRRGGLSALLAPDATPQIGMTLVTEWPALLDQQVLSSAEVLVVARTSERPDQDVVHEWVRSRADGKTASKVVDSLASMSERDAWVCSPPAWIGRCQRVTLRHRATCAGFADGWQGAERHLATRELDRLHTRVDSARVAADVGGPPLVRLPLRTDARPVALVRAEQPSEPRRLSRRSPVTLVDPTTPRRGRPVARLILDAEERVELERLADQPGQPVAIALRARIVLACAEGRLNSDVAREFGTTNQMVGRWRQRFVERRLDGLCPSPHNDFSGQTERSRDAV